MATNHGVLQSISNVPTLTLGKYAYSDGTFLGADTTNNKGAKIEYNANDDLVITSRQGTAASNDTMTMSDGTTTFSTRLDIDDTTASTSVSTGCATFAGGVGIAGTLYVQDLSIGNEYSFNSLSVSGGANFNGSITMGNQNSDEISFIGRTVTDFVPKYDGNHVTEGNRVSLGTSDLGFRNLHLSEDGSINFDGGDVTITHSTNKLTLAGGTLDLGGNDLDNAGAITCTSINVTSTSADSGSFANLSSSGNTDLGSDNNDTLTINAVVDSNIVPDADNTRDLGSSTVGWNVYATSLDLSDGNITNVGSMNCDSITVDDATVGLNLQFSGNTGLNKISLTDNLANALDITQDGNSYLKFVTTDNSEQIVFGQNWTANGRTCADLGTVTTADINGGNIDGTTIGANSAAAGSFTSVVATSLTVSDGNITNVGDISLDSISADDGSSFSFGSNWTAATRTCADLGTVTTADINGGSIDGTTIGANSTAAGNFTTLATSSTLTVGTDLTVTGSDITLGNGADATLKVEAVSGTDTDGKNLTLSAGQGTGSGAGGSLVFQVADGGATGTDANDLVTALTIADDKTATFEGDVVIRGTTTTLNSTTVTIEDPIFTLGGDSAPTSDDDKDRGIEFRYYDGSAKTGFFGYDDHSGLFTYVPDATNTSEVITGTVGKALFNEIQFNDALGDGTNAAKISSDNGTTLVLDSTVLDLNATSSITVDAGAGLSLDAGAASNLTTSDGALTLNGATGVNIVGNASEVDITTTGAVDINSAAFTVDASAGVSVDAAAASNFTTSAGALTLDGAAGVSIAGNAAEVDITTTGAVDINSGAFTVDGTTLSLDSTDTTNLTMTANNANDRTMTIAASNSGGGNGNIDMDADGAITMDAGAASNLTTSAGALTLSGAAGVTLTSTGGSLLLNGTGQTVTLNSTSLNTNGSHIHTGTFTVGTTGTGHDVKFFGDSNDKYMLWDQAADTLKVEGTVQATNVIAVSDGTLKTNISPLNDPLATINKLHGVQYDWKDPNNNDHEIGLIAQDVETVVPEVVRTLAGTNLKGVEYQKLTAILIEAVKELSNQVNELKKN